MYRQIQKPGQLEKDSEKSNKSSSWTGEKKFMEGWGQSSRFKAIPRVSYSKRQLIKHSSASPKTE